MAVSFSRTLQALNEDRRRWRFTGLALLCILPTALATEGPIVAMAVEVSAGEPGIPAGWLDAARASLGAMRFAPARKDERAVRSRLLLSVSFPAGEGRRRDEAN